MITSMKTRYLVVKLILDSGQFPGGDEGNPSTKTIFSSSDANSLAIECNITKQEGFQANHAELKIFGMSDKDIEAFSRFRITIQTPIAANSVEIYAGYELNSDGLPPFIYKGVVLTSYPNYNDVNRPFVITSITGLVVNNNIQQSLNIKGSNVLDDVLRNMVSNAGLAYNPYVDLTSTIIRNPNYVGGLSDQLQRICDDYGLLYKISDDYRNVFVTAKGQPFVNQSILLAPGNPILGYPTVLDTAIQVRIRYNPAIQFGQQVSLQSHMPLASGDGWYINAIQHSLMSKGRQWESLLTLQKYIFGG